MIEQDLLKKHYVGRDGFIWWMGQVASDSWKQNKGGSSPEPTKPLKVFRISAGRTMSSMICGRYFSTQRNSFMV